MELTRRDLLLGSVALVAIAAAGIPGEQRWAGIRWQSWPYGSERPSEFAQGTIGGGGTAHPESYWLRRLERHHSMWGNVFFEPLEE